MKTTWLIPLVLFGCAVDVDADAEDDSFLAEGKADTGGIGPGGPDAVAVLRVANELSRTQLVGAGVASNAATNIAGYRLGDDEVAGTSDDEKFDALAELDAVPFVGPVAFHKLLDYARSHGFVGAADHFAPLACTAMTYDELIARVPAGTNGAEVGGFHLDGRARPCNRYTGCGTWAPASVVVRQDVGGAAGLGAAIHPLPTSGRTHLRIGPHGSVDFHMSAPAPTAPADLISWHCHGPRQGESTGFWCVTSVANALPPPGYFTNDPLASWVLDRHADMYLTGSVCKDGRYAFISALSPATVPEFAVENANNTHQIAIYGQL